MPRSNRTQPVIELILYLDVSRNPSTSKKLRRGKKLKMISKKESLSKMASPKQKYFRFGMSGAPSGFEKKSMVTMLQLKKD